MIERIADGAYLATPLSSTPNPFRLGLDGKEIGAPTAFRSSAGLLWNGTGDKRLSGRGSTPPATTTPPTTQSDTVVMVPSPGTQEVYKMAPEGGFNPSPRGRLPKESDTSIAPPPTSGPPPVNQPPVIPPPSASPDDAGHETDDNIDDLTDLYRETFTGGGGSGGATSGGGTAIIPTTFAESGGGGGGGGNGLVMVLVLLTLGAAGYFGWKWYKKHKAAA